MKTQNRTIRLETHEDVPPWRKARVQFRPQRPTRLQRMFGSDPCHVDSVRVGTTEYSPKLLPVTANVGEVVELTLANHANYNARLFAGLDVTELL